LSQAAIKNSDNREQLRTVVCVIDSRQATPAHIRDLLLLAATVAAGEPSIDISIVADLDTVDVMAVTGQLVAGQLQALTASAHSPAERHHAAGEVLAAAAVRVPDPRAVNAAATVVGAISQGELATGAAVARCLAAFTPDELAEASIALLSSSIAALAGCAGVTVGEIIAWSAGEPTATPTTRPPRAMFCSRDAVELHLDHHGR
jgi:hypothetical protein